MAETTQAKRKISSATIALVIAALFAAAAVAIALFRSNDTATEAATGNAAASQPQQAGSVDDMVASLRERLRQDPDNHEGWHMLGLAYREMGRFPEAEQAFRRAMELSPRNADYVAYLAEALVLRGGEGDGPPAEAEQLFRRALELQPGNPQARYYLATIRDLRGDHRGAVDDLVALLREAPADAPWEPQVRGAVESIARQNNIDLAGRLPAQRQPAPSTATAAIPGPTREQLEQAKGLPPSQQDAMVQGMVSRLEGRLRQNPRDADRWIMLMRSRMVLNQPDGAREALRSSLAAFPNDAATQQRLRTAAQELGVPGN